MAGFTLNTKRGVLLLTKTGGRLWGHTKDVVGILSRKKRGEKNIANVTNAINIFADVRAGDDRHHHTNSSIVF